MKRKLALSVAVATLVCVAAVSAQRAGQQHAVDYTPPKFTPAFTARGPIVAIDGTHGEMHAIDRGYAPFAALLRADGVRAVPFEARMTAATLAGVDVLVIANAKPEGEQEDLTDGHKQAFLRADLDALDQWVTRGGSLLLVADHHPFGGYVRDLSQRFGVRMSEGFVADVGQTDPAWEDEGRILYRRGVSLGQHWITRPLKAVQSFTGQALRSDKGTCLLALGPKSELFNAVATRTGDDVHVSMQPGGSARGWCQGIALVHGRGRVVVLGEAAMLTAQVDRRGNPFGMQVPGADDATFALQVVRWLARVDERKTDGAAR